MEKLTDAHKSSMKRAAELSEITDSGLIDLIYLLEMAANGDDSTIFDPGQIDFRDSGVTLGIYGKVPEQLWESDPDDLPDEDDFNPTMMRIRFDVVANESSTARCHGIATRTLQRWTREGLPSYKVGRERFFIKTDVEEFAKKMESKRW